MNGLGAPAAAGAVVILLISSCCYAARVWFRCCCCCSCCAVARAIDSEFLTAAGILEKLAKIQKLIVFFLMYFVCKSLIKNRNLHVFERPEIRGGFLKKMQFFKK
jgi:hypothetical protein